jgi:hypothetical protein
VAGTITGSMVFNIAHPVSPALGSLAPPPMNPCVPASAVKTAITVTSAADAAGVSVSVAAWGLQLRGLPRILGARSSPWLRSVTRYLPHSSATSSEGSRILNSEKRLSSHWR